MNQGRRSTDNQPWYYRGSLLVGAVVAMFAAVLLFTALLIWVGAAIDEAKCDAYSAETGRDTRYTFMVGCLIKLQDGWVQKEEFRQVQRLNP